MGLTVLSVAYPLAAVGPDAVGGSEQILGHLDRALVKAGHRSLVIACEGSIVEGMLLETPRLPNFLDDLVKRRAQAAFRQKIAETIAKWRIDLVHMHGLDFHEYLPPPGPPVLATLHLPASWYPPHVFDLQRQNTFLNCVSAAQRADCPSDTNLLPDIPNGVPIERLRANHARRNFALGLGRICPEKGFHIALDAGTRANTPVLIGGELFKYDAHVQYFRDELQPRLLDRHRFLGPLKFKRKRRLLSAAKCLLVPSLVAETSSLVAMEALACGTPVIAFPAGALPQVVEHGRTGFLVSNEAEMAEAIQLAHTIDPEACRAAARARFSLDRMVGRYLELYQKLSASKGENRARVPVA